MSKETLKKALMRALEAFSLGALTSFVVIPVNLEDPNKYMYALFIGLIAGGLQGLKKFIKGYIQYDK